MEIEYILLGLIKLYGEVTGYELNRIIRDSNRYFITVSLAYLYPVLKRLHQRGWITYSTTPIRNRLDKKSYRITPLGEIELKTWLEAPIEEDMYFRSFLIKMQFATFMDENTIRDHLDREIHRLQEKLRDMEQLSNCIESGKLDAKSCEALALITRLLRETDELRSAWLKTWRTKLNTN